MISVKSGFNGFYYVLLRFIDFSILKGSYRRMRIQPSRYVVMVVGNAAFEYFSKVFLEENVKEGE